MSILWFKKKKNTIFEFAVFQGGNSNIIEESLCQYISNFSRISQYFFIRILPRTKVYFVFLLGANYLWLVLLTMTFGNKYFFSQWYISFWYKKLCGANIILLCYIKQTSSQSVLRNHFTTIKISLELISTRDGYFN